MADLARETASLHDTVTQAVERQLNGLSTGFEATTSSVADIWKQALAEHQRSSEALSNNLSTSLARFTETFEQRSAGLLEGVSTRLEATAGSVSEAWSVALSRQESVSGKMADDNQQALATAAATFEQHSASLLRTVGQSHADLQAELASRDEERLAAWTASLGLAPSELVHGCPVLPRWAFAGTTTTMLLVAAYLGQPLVLRGHHRIRIRVLDEIPAKQFEHLTVDALTERVRDLIDGELPAQFQAAR